MNRVRIAAALRRQVRERANGHCEYCLIAESQAFFPHEPDHIIAQKHGGQTVLNNLALACFDCNRFKGLDICFRRPRFRNSHSGIQPAHRWLARTLPY